MKLPSIVLGACLLGMSSFVNADDLKISNSTNKTLAFNINGACSSELGIISPDSITIIPEKKFKKICQQLRSCTADIVTYTTDCTVTRHYMGEITFDSEEGVSRVIPYGIIGIKGHGFSLFFY